MAQFDLLLPPLVLQMREFTVVALALVAVLQISTTGEVARPAAPARGRPTTITTATDSQQLARAESLLLQGQLRDARRLAEQLQDRYPRDPRVLVALGRILLAWPTVGRYAADSLFCRAAELDPDNPEPWYLSAEVGRALGGEDGEEFQRRGLVGALTRNPDYRDAWSRWMSLWRRDEDRGHMADAMRRHAGMPIADYHRAIMLEEMDRNDEAADLFATVVEHWPRDPAVLAWFARASFAAGRDSAGAAAYEEALLHADDDTGQVLWKQIRGIATPAERDSFALTPAGALPAFYRFFWARREPSLAAPYNQRFAEHFHRLSVATHQFALTHPGSRYFHSAAWRALSGEVGNAPDHFGAGGPARAAAAQTSCSARRSSVRDAAVQAGVRPRVEMSPDVTLNMEDNIDDRGRVYLRHGEPTYRYIGPHAESETWCYFLPGGRQLRVSFLARSSGFAGTGDMVMTPMVVGEAEAARELLDTDRSTIANSDLEFAFWTASFRASDGRTDLLVFTDSLSGVGVLLDAEGREASRGADTGRLLRLTARPGRYGLMIDGARGDREGHYRGSTVLPDLRDWRLGVSSILMAAGATRPVRDSVVAAVPPRLEMRASQPVRVYAEIYGLGNDSGLARYRAEYQFERTDGFIIGRSRERVSTIAFDRERPVDARMVESLIIDPDRLPPGRYRLRLEITDQVRHALASSTTIEFRLR